MSAFLVEDKTINAIVTYLATQRNGEFHRQLIKDRLGLDLNTLEGRRSLGWAMFKLNIRAVNQRYADGKAEDFRPLNYKFALVDGYTLPAVIKFISCWHYQCCEGDCDETELYKLMEKIRDNLCYNVVVATKEYEMAKWG